MPPSPRSSSPVLAQTKGFRLLDLPFEVQDMVFDLCLATGNTQILLLSKDVHTRTVPFLYKNAYFRLDSRDVEEREKRSIIKFKIYRIPLRLPTSKISLIQNISMHIDLGNMDDNAVKNLRSDRGSRQGPVINFAMRPWTRIARRRIFQLNISLKDSGLGIEADLLGKVIKDLTTFEVVIVTAITKTQRADGYAQPYQPCQRVSRARNRQVYSIFRQEWECTLGPAEFYDSPGQEGRYLEFRPRKHLASVAAGLK